MASLNESERTEYAVLMSRGRDAERTSHFCWIASGVAATVLLSWAIAARRPPLMLPVIFAVAYGFYTTIHGRQQTRLIAGYVKEFFEGRDAGGPQWFTRLGHLEIMPGFSPSMSDWLSTGLANAVVVIAIVFASLVDLSRARSGATDSTITLWATSTPPLNEKSAHARAPAGSPSSRRTPANPNPWINPKPKAISARTSRPLRDARMFSTPMKAMVSAIAGSTIPGEGLRMPRVARASVMLWATVKAVTILRSLVTLPPRSRRPTMKS